MHTGIRRMGQRNCIYSALRQELMDTMFQDKVGSYDSSRYEVDLNKQYFAMVSDTGKVTAKAHLLASIAVEPPTLMWGYADELAQFGKAVELAHKVREYGLEHKENDLVSPEVEYTFPSDIDQQLVIASVAHDIGFAAITIFGTGIITTTAHRFVVVAVWCFCLRTSLSPYLPLRSTTSTHACHAICNRWMTLHGRWRALWS